jgi:uncharacterized protein
MVAAGLALAGALITIAVYGAVAVIVKADDLGLVMAASGRLALTRKMGAWIVQGMPVFMRLLVVVGTAAMIWVGGSIIVHGAAELGFTGVYEAIHEIAVSAGEAAAAAHGAVGWIVTAALDGAIGLAIGVGIVAVMKFVVEPIIDRSGRSV